jgi:RNA-directed DNA polymerase
MPDNYQALHYWSPILGDHAVRLSMFAHGHEYFAIIPRIDGKAWPRLVKNSRRGSLFWSFTPAVSQAALTAMRETIRKTNLRNRTQITLEDIANEINPVLRGWIEYYGRYCPSALYPMFRHVNRSLVAWAMRKYKRLAGHRTRASIFLETISKKTPYLFARWRKETVGAFA